MTAEARHLSPSLLLERPDAGRCVLMGLPAALSPSTVWRQRVSSDCRWQFSSVVTASANPYIEGAFRPAAMDWILVYSLSLLTYLSLLTAEERRLSFHLNHLLKNSVNCPRPRNGASSYRIAR